MRIIIAKVFDVGIGKIRLNINYILDDNNIKHEIILRNINRYELIEVPHINQYVNLEVEEDRVDGLKGYLLTIELYQLAIIFNKVGNKLFRRNLRYGLKEQMGVDKAIHDTLSEQPEKFWFLNNGVTILVEREGFDLDHIEEIVLEPKNRNGEYGFSVINGAQTITAAADFYFTQEYKVKNEVDKKIKSEEEKRFLKAKEAKVLLRIIQIQPENSESKNISMEKISFNKEINDISIALNRQKPIKAEDIAFATHFVEKLVEFLENQDEKSAEYFKLVKRGETTEDVNTIDLVEFARAGKACIQKPGDARAKSANTLLKIISDENMDYVFSDKQVFKNEWLNADEDEENNVFCKYYGAIKFAVRLSHLYEKYSKDDYDNIDYNIIIKNGKWYFTALMIFILNDGLEDFSNFNYDSQKIEKEISKLIIEFAKMIKDIYNMDDEGASNKIQSDKLILDSNTFKNEQLFKRIIKCKDKVSAVDKFNKYILSIFKLDEVK